MRLVLVFLVGVLVSLAPPVAAHAQVIQYSASGTITPLAVDPQWSPMAYYLLGATQFSRTASLTQSYGPTDWSLLEALDKTCNISWATGWTIDFVPMWGYAYYVWNYDAWAETSPWYFWHNVPVGGQNFSLPNNPVGGAGLNVYFVDALDYPTATPYWANGAQTHWIQVVSENGPFPPDGQRFITGPTYGGAHPVITYIDNANRSDSMPWSDNSDRSIGPTTPADSTQFVDIPTRIIASDSKPVWVANLYLAWLSGPRHLTIAQYGIQWGFYGQ